MEKVQQDNWFWYFPDNYLWSHRLCGNLNLALVGGAQLRRVNYSHFEKIRIPLLLIDFYQEIVEDLEGYQKIINGNKTFIEIYAQKIQDRISKVWGEEISGWAYQLGIECSCSGLIVSNP